MQILTIEEILNRKKPDTPPEVSIYKSDIKGKEREGGTKKKASFDIKRSLKKPEKPKPSHLGFISKFP